MQLVRGAIKLPQRQIIRGNTPCVFFSFSSFSLFGSFWVSFVWVFSLFSARFYALLEFVVDRWHVVLHRYTRSRNLHEMTQEQRNIVGYFDAVVKLESKAADLYRMFQNLLQKSNDHRSTRREFEGSGCYC